MSKKKREGQVGRPPKPPGEKYVTPQFWIGRVPKETQDKIREGTPDGESFRDWAVRVLLAAAEKTHTKRK